MLANSVPQFRAYGIKRRGQDYPVPLNVYTLLLKPWVRGMALSAYHSTLLWHGLPANADSTFEVAFAKIFLKSVVLCMSGGPMSAFRLFSFDILPSLQHSVARKCLQTQRSVKSGKGS
jgi:hypothetical protein